MPQSGSLLVSEGQRLYLAPTDQAAELIPQAPNGELLWYKPGSLGMLGVSSQSAQIRQYFKEVAVGKPVKKGLMLVYVGTMSLLLGLLLWRYKIFNRRKSSATADQSPKAVFSPLERLSSAEPRGSDALPKLSDRIRQIKSGDLQ